MLADGLEVDQRAVVKAVVAKDPRFRLRLLELGFTQGARVARVGQAPIGDPLLFRVRGSTVSLRRLDASMIEVTPCE
jgi:Fe2+ transport system protein FeoA